MLKAVVNQNWERARAGVGQVVEESELYGSPHFALFYQGNDHAARGCHLHDAARQCSDCAAVLSSRISQCRKRQQPRDLK